MVFQPLPQARHEMVLETDLDADTGAERWGCPDCGRLVLIRWSPEFERVVLVAGDEHAIHVGGKGGAQVGSIGLAADESERERAAREWLAEHGIVWDGPAA